MTTTTREIGKGHREFIGPWDYFTTDDGQLYRGPSSAPLDCITGYRMGARWEAPAHLADQFLALAREAFSR